MRAVKSAEVADLPYHQWKDLFVWTEGETPDLWGEFKNHILTNPGTQNVRFIEEDQQWFTGDNNVYMLELTWVQFFF